MTCPVHKRKGQVQILKRLSSSAGSRSRQSAARSLQLTVFRQLRVDRLQTDSSSSSSSSAASASSAYSGSMQAVRIFLLASGGNVGSFVATLTTTTTSTTDDDRPVAIKFLGERTHFNDESDDSGIGLVVVILLAVVAVSQEAATVAAATREMLICVRCSLVVPVVLGFLSDFQRYSNQLGGLPAI